MQEVIVGSNWIFDFAVREGSGAPQDADSTPTIPNTKTQVDGSQTSLTGTVTQLQDNTATAIPGIYQAEVTTSGLSEGEVATVIVDATLDSVDQSAVFTAVIVPAMRGTDNANTTVPLAASVSQTEHDATQSAIAALNDISPAAVNAEVDTALADYDAPTKVELDTAQASIEADIAAIAAAPSAAAIADAVWDEDLSGHQTTSTAGDVTKDQSYLNGVYVDLDAGTAGTGYLVGTPSLPVDNLTDALSIASTQNVASITFVGAADSLTASAADIATINSQAINFKAEVPTVFEFSPTGGPHNFGGVTWEGAFQLNTANVGNLIIARMDDLLLLQIDAGTALWETVIRRTRVEGNFTRVNALGQSIRFIDCFSSQSGSFTLTGTSQTGNWGVELIRFAGDVLLRGFTNSNGSVDAQIDLLGGIADVDATNTEPGAIRITGIGGLTGSAAGSVDDDRITVGATPGEIADQVWVEALSDHSGTSGSTAEALAEVQTDTNAVLVDTDTTIPGLISGLNDLSAAEVKAEADSALADYDGPTNAELTAAIGGLNDLTASAVADAVWQADLSAISAGSGDAAETLRTLEKIFTNDATVVDIGGGVNQVTIFDDDGTTVLRRMNVSSDGLTRDVVVGG